MSHVHKSFLCPVADIIDPENAMRTDFDPQAMAELMDSMQRTGLLQPILIKKHGDKFEVIAGHRRLTAARKLGWELINTIVIDAQSVDAELMKVHENLIRENVHILDEALYLQQLKTSKNLTNEQVASLIHRSRSYVETRINCLVYPPELLEALKANEINITVAEQLARILDEKLRIHYLRHAVESGASGVIVKQWADSCTMLDETPASDNNSEEKSTIVPHVDNAIMECAVCNTKHDFTKTRVVRICFGCCNEMNLHG